VKTRAAILRGRNQPWSVEEIELDPPKAGEVLVKLAASGMCHSDEHLVTGDLAGASPEPPLIGGHEGAGVVVEVVDGISSLEPGDHVVFGFIPSCGNCSYCAEGRSNLCDNSATFPTGMQIGDGTARHHDQGGQDLGLMCLLGTFAEHTVVNESSCVKIDKQWPLDKACLLGCCVVTGWGSAVYAAEVKPGDYVAVVGFGGVGANAMQGAKMAGARVVASIDPVAWKHETAIKFGATHTYPSMTDAIGDLENATWNRGYDKVIMATGLGTGDQIGEAFWLAGKGSKIVITNQHSMAEQTISLSAALLTLFEKQLIGSLFGSGNIRKDIRRLMELYTQGQLNLDDLITRTYTLDQINDGFDAMRNGENIRGVIMFD